MVDKKEKKLVDFNFEGTRYKTLITDSFASRKTWEKEDPNIILAVIPGRIVRINVKEGQKVNKGRCLYVLEAMKMNNKILCPKPGEVKKIHGIEGQIVTKNELIMELKDLTKKPSKSLKRSKTQKAQK